MSRLGVSHPSPTTVEDFRRVLDERAIQPLFQPLIDLQHRHVLGYEALARGPMGSALESPAALFGAAWWAGRVSELDWVCRAAAFLGGGGLGPGGVPHHQGRAGRDLHAAGAPGSGRGRAQRAAGLLPGRRPVHPGDDGPDDQRRYDVVVTHDRELAIRAAEPLLRRLVPEH